MPYIVKLRDMYIAGQSFEHTFQHDVPDRCLMARAQTAACEMIDHVQDDSFIVVVSAPFQCVLCRNPPPMTATGPSSTSSAECPPCVTCCSPTCNLQECETDTNRQHCILLQSVGQGSKHAQSPILVPGLDPQGSGLHRYIDLILHTQKLLLVWCAHTLKV